MYHVIFIYSCWLCAGKIIKQFFLKVLAFVVVGAATKEAFIYFIIIVIIWGFFYFLSLCLRLCKVQ